MISPGVTMPFPPSRRRFGERGSSPMSTSPSESLEAFAESLGSVAGAGEGGTIEMAILSNPLELWGCSGFEN